MDLDWGAHLALKVDCFTRSKHEPIAPQEMRQKLRMAWNSIADKPGHLSTYWKQTTLGLVETTPQVTYISRKDIITTLHVTQYRYTTF